MTANFKLLSKATGRGNVYLTFCNPYNPSDKPYAVTEFVNYQAVRKIVGTENSQNQYEWTISTLRFTPSEETGEPGTWDYVETPILATPAVIKWCNNQV